MPATEAISTPARTGDFSSHPTAAGVVLYKGALAALNAAGHAVPAADTAALRVVGMAVHTVDNQSGGDGAASITVQTGVFGFSNSATHPLAAADVGKLAIVEDDTTVAANSTHRICAGRVFGVSDGFVWVDTRPAGTPHTIPSPASVAGEAATAADLPALAAATEKIGDDVRKLAAALCG